MTSVRWWLLVMMVAFACRATAGEHFTVLSYHEVVDDPSVPRSGEFPAVTTSDLVSQFAWLREHDYTVISLDDVLNARNGKRSLPDRSVLLTFDDGYASLYTRVYPLLKAFDYRAIAAVVGAWMTPPEGAEVAYGEGRAPRSKFLSWAQLREMAATGHIEVASHTYDLHHGIDGNPQLNLQPAAVTRRYESYAKRYETEQQYLARIADDIRRNSDLIAEQTGKRPRVMVWPYGAYNEPLLRTAHDVGMEITLTLDEGAAHTNEMRMVRRELVQDGADLQQVIWNVEHVASTAPLRVMHVDLDYVHSDDAQQQEKNLSALLNRVERLNINTVYLQAFSDADGDGAAEAVYFPNRHMPVKADLFNRVAWQLRTRTRVAVYAWMPVLAFKLPATHPAAALRVESAHANDQRNEYLRLSPFSPVARETIGEIYDDLARYGSFQGVLFHDDAFLTDFEDISAAALSWYKEQWRLPADIEAIRADPQLSATWAAKKTEYLTQWSRTLLQRVEYWRPRMRSARNLYANVILRPESEQWYAQSLPNFLANYDYTAVMAMPYMERASSPDHWYRELVERVHNTPNALERTVFELQTVDWRSSKRIDAVVLATQMQELQRLGVRHLGYYPDDFIQDHPDVATLIPAFSLSQYPYRE